MSRKLELELEKNICEKVIDCLLLNNYKITVNALDNDDDILKKSSDKEAIKNCLFETVNYMNEVILYVNKKGEKEKFVNLIWGEVECIINNFSVSLEPFLKEVNDFAASYQD